MTKKTGTNTDINNPSKLSISNLDSCDLLKINSTEVIKQRLSCSVCNHRIDLNNESTFATFRCNVRAYMDEKFKVWRCPDCKTIHCLDVVDLDYYYAKYPIAQGALTWPHRMTYRNIYRQLKKHGLFKTHSVLDYGCGVNGMFIQYLRQNGFTNCYGYEPYAPEDSFGNKKSLQERKFDYILLQDVIEHVEESDALLSELNSLLSPGGYILIGTPNAANINLNRPDLSDYYNEVHVPYHLHIYTRESIESLGRRQKWEPVDFFDRSYSDTLWPGLNVRTWNEYERLCDGSIDVIYESISPWKGLTSYKFIFYMIFGYWLSFRTGMTVMFRKNIDSH